MSSCAECGHENPRGNVFCGACGARLGAAPASAAGYTPAHLSDEILTRRRALQGERKQVTVMFVDLKGSLALSDQLDPEVWHRLLDRFFSLLAGAVHDFEGTINQFTGDGIMALFGAPLAHEDHAYRACRAALRMCEEVRIFADEIRREHGIALAARIGLNSGEVVVGSIGDDLRMDYTAQGATVGLAARMQELAEPGRPCLAEGTAELVERLVDLRELGPVAVKGLNRRVRVFELLGLGAVRTRFEAARARGLSPFLGRAKEANALEQAIASATSGEGAIVGLVGAPGVGKSRLAFEALQHARAAGLSVIETEGLAHGRRLPLLPVAQLVRRYLGLGENEGGEAARQKIAGRLVLLDRELAPLLPLIFDFLGLGDPERTIPIDPSARQRQLFEVVRRFLRAQSDREPTVLLLEDLHWFDPASDRVLEQIVEAVMGTRLMVLVTYRPEYEAPWMKSQLFRRIELDALPGEVADDLLRELLGDDPSVAAVARSIRATAGGNPLFLEEVVRSLVESGALEGERGAYRATREVEEIEVPSSVQSVLAERLDRLPEAERATLETAAIIGPRLPAALLGRVLDRPAPELAEHLARLCALDLLQREPSGDGETYAFRHPLIQDVAFRSQLAEHRAPTHARLAEILSKPIEGQSEPAALVALHWERAGDFENAARANARAAAGTGSLDPVETFRLWSRTRELAARLGESGAGAILEATACVQLLNFGWRHGIGQEEVDELFFRGRALLEGVGNVGFQAMLHASYGRNLACTAHADAYLEQAEQALALARESGSDELAGTMESVVAHALRHAGRLEESLRLMEAGLERLQKEADETGIGFGQSLGFSRALWLRALRGDTLVFMGRLANAESDETEVAATATARGDADMLILPRYAAVTVAWARGDPGGGLAQAREAAEIAERQGSPYARVLAGSSLGFALLQIGDGARAADVLEAALATARERRAGLDLEGRLLSLLAEARFWAGAPDAASLADEAAERSRLRRTPVFECFAELARARINAVDAPDVCDEALLRIAELVGRTGARLFTPFAERVRAMRARAAGDARGAEAAHAAAREGFAKMGAEGWVARLDRGEVR